MATLALGVGASTAIFSMVNGILLEPLPLPDPDRLVYANEMNRGQQISVSWPNFLDWRARAHSFEGLADSREEPLTLTGVDRARRVRTRRVTGNFFQVLGVPPVIGRGFVEDDDRANAAPVALVSDGFWRTALGADPKALGTILQLDQIPYTVVGVLPRGFQYLRPYDLFVSMGPVSGSAQLLRRGNHNGWYALGRLKTGVGLEAADRELQSIAAALEREYPNTNAAVTVRVERLSDRFVASIRPTLLALFGAVGCLLLIACVNVASLLIARGAARHHELAVRAALGGGRLRLIVQLLTESTVVSVAGGVLGIGIAWLLLRALVAAAPDGTPRISDVTLDGTALLFAVGAAAACGLIFGAFPALQASGARGATLVRARAAGASSSSHRVRRGLIVVESALALVLLAGAGLMIRTVAQLSSVDPGFRVDHLFTARFTLPGRQWPHERRQPFFAELLTRVRAVPGVANAALTFSLPIDGSQWNSIFIVADKPVPPRADLPNAAINPVSAGYFDTMGMRLIRGRLLNAGDTTTSAPVLVVNELLAKQIWPGEDPLGKRFKQGWPEDPGTWREVVGVVGDVKLDGLIAKTPMQAFLPVTQESSYSMVLVARTAVAATSIVPAMEAAVRQLDKDLPLYQASSMDEILAASIARQRMSVIVFVIFAVVALALAAIGLYGVVSHGVTERTHEIGVRMALGAGRGNVLSLIVRQGLSMTAVGVALGLAGAAALSRSIEGLLFGVTPTDPATFGVVSAVLLAVAAVACYVPAWRATRVEPTQALRAE